MQLRTTLSSFYRFHSVLFAGFLPNSSAHNFSMLAQWNARSKSLFERIVRSGKVRKVFRNCKKVLNDLRDFKDINDLKVLNVAIL